MHIHQVGVLSRFIMPRVIQLTILSLRRSLSKTYSVAPSPDSSSSEYQSLENQPPPTPEAQQRPSLLSRLFRRSGRQKTRQIDSYSAQFPPTEWFNSRTVHLHNVGTQTNDQVSVAWRVQESAMFINYCLSIPRICPCPPCCPILMVMDQRSVNSRLHSRGDTADTSPASLRL